VKRSHQDPEGRGLLRGRAGGEQQVTPFELFFDLVFVFAVTQLSQRLLDQLALGGAAQATPVRRLSRRTDRRGRARRFIVDPAPAVVR
jgi:hypothetical protein